MLLITADTETYFADSYTLSKKDTTTESYVRDPRFKLHMTGFKVSDGITEISNTVPRILHGAAVVGHHQHFDGLIFSHHYGICPAFYFDTLSMARLIFPHAKSHSLGSLAKMLGLPEKTVPYESFKNVRDLPPDLYNKVAEGCAHDVELTYSIFKAMLPHVPKDELRLIDLTIRLFTQPQLALDRDKLTHYIQTTRETKDGLLDSLGITRDDVNSAERFAGLLEGLGVEPPRKISKTTGKSTYAFSKTDSGLKELLDHENPVVCELVAARLGVKSNSVETRAQRLLDMDTRGAMCVYLKYYGAHVGRFSGGDSMNWQNFKRGSALREAILAPEGYVLCVVDSSQIEARLLDWFCGEDEMLDKFRRKEDIYSEVASEFYGEPVDKSKPDKRGMGKQIILSCGFGAGADSIQNTARIGTYGPPVILTDAQALAARDLYRRLHPGVVAQWGYAGKVVLPALLKGNADFMWGCLHVFRNRIIFPGGAWIDYSNLRHDGENYYQIRRKGNSKTYGGKLIQNITEGLSRTFLKEKWLKISEKYRVVLSTHDELVYLALEAHAQEAFDWGIEVMKQPPVWAPDLPLDAEGGYAANYSK